MEANHQTKQFIDRITCMEGFFGEQIEETKHQIVKNVELQDWKLVDILSESATWLDAGIMACGQMKTRLEAETAATTATPDPFTSTRSRQPIEISSESDSHPFWPTFFERGRPFHPELANKTPTGGRRKIGPTILPGIQIDVAYSSRGVSCRLLSSKPEKLKPILKLKPQFTEAVDGEIEWNDGTKNRSHLSVTIRPASNLEQQGWTIEEKVARLLKLYGEIKSFVHRHLA